VSLARWLWLLAASLGVVVVQLTCADKLSLAGVHPELVWVLPVAAGLAAGATTGMAAGFVGGAVADLFLPAPFGLTALVAVFAGYATGRLGEEGVGDLGGAAWGVAPALGVATGLVAPLVYAVLAAIGGHRSYLSINLLVVSGLDAVACGLLVRPVMALLGRRIAGDAARAGPLEPVRGTL
jgi:rod shape-determining protein MreD